MYTINQHRWSEKTFYAGSDGKTLAADKKNTFENRVKFDKNKKTNMTGLIQKREIKIKKETQIKKETKTKKATKIK